MEADQVSGKGGADGTESRSLLQRQLEDEVRRRVDRLTRVSAEFYRLGEAEDVMQGIVDALELRLGFEFGAILVWDAASGSLRPRAVSRQGRDAAFIAADKQYIVSRLLGGRPGITGWVGRTGETARVDDVRSDPRYFGMREGIISELCAPIIARGRVLGVLNSETTRRAAYDAADQRVIEAISREVSLAVLVEEELERAGTRTPASRDSEKIMTVCAWCGRIQTPSGLWIRRESEAGLRSSAQLSHGICPSCRDKLTSGMDHTG